MHISGSALSAQRIRMELAANNLANANTTGPNGPYRRQIPVFSEIVINHRGAGPNRKEGGGVRVSQIIEDQTPFQRIYDPENPQADAQGYVEKPNVNVVHEMIDLMAATRAYEANASVLNDTKRLMEAAIQIAT